MNPYENAKKQISVACEYMKIDEGIAESLKYCTREVCVNFPVKMDDEGFRAVREDARLRISRC